MDHVRDPLHPGTRLQAHVPLNMAELSQAAGKRVIAAFDFDGTLTTGDSLIPFLTANLGAIALARHFLMISPTLFGLAAGRATRSDVKEKLFRRIFAGEPAERWESAGESFIRRELPRLMKQGAIGRIEWHRDQGHHTALVSASPDIYMRHVARELRIDSLICTTLGRDGSCLTGGLPDGNCVGQEKARRLRELAERLGGGCEIYAYGDSKGDREMLAMADHAFYRTL